MSFSFNVSEIQYEILGILHHNEGLYGLQIVQVSEKLKRATIYVHLSRMEDKGWLRREVPSDSNQSGSPRWRYFLTQEGLRVRGAVEAARKALS